MKKAIAAVLTVIMLFGACGCSGESMGLKKNRAYFYSFSSAEDESGFSESFTIKDRIKLSDYTDRLESRSKGEERKISFLGQQYTVFFTGQAINNWGTESTYDYRTSDGCIFRLGRNGEILYYQDNVTEYDVHDAEGDEVRTPGEIRKIADGLFAKMYPGELAAAYEAPDLQVDVSKVPYKVTYMLKESPSADSSIRCRTNAIFVFDAGGKLLEFLAVNMGRFSGKKFPEYLSGEWLAQTIRKELGSGAEIELEGDKTVWILRDGRMACTVYFRDAAALPETHLHLALIPLE